MNLNLEDLKRTCHQLAQSIGSLSKQLSTTQVQKLATKFYTLASRKAKNLHAANKDAEVVNRAAWIISLVYTTAPTEGHVAWFRELLDALLALAFPATPGTVTRPLKFLQNLLLDLRPS